MGTFGTVFSCCCCLILTFQQWQITHKARVLVYHRILPIVDGTLQRLVQCERIVFVGTEPGCTGTGTDRAAVIAAPVRVREAVRQLRL